MLPSKPVLLWAFWPDDLSRALEHHFRVEYLQVEAMPAPKFNYHLPSLLGAAREETDRPRLLFLHAWSLCDSLQGIDGLGIPCAVYLHDTHFRLNSWAWDLSQSFDCVWLDTHESVEYFVRRGATNLVMYCPLYYKGSKERISSFAPNRPRPLDVAFIGNWARHLHPERHAFFEGLKEKLRGKFQFHFGSGEVEDVYPRAKIVINETVPPPFDATARSVIDAPNFRIFEAMGCGAMLLCDSPSPAVRALFDEGKDFVGYRHADVVDAAEKLEYYLARDSERIGIAENGWRRVVEQHSPEARAETIAPVLLELIGRDPSPSEWTAERRFLLGRSMLRQALVWRAQAPSAGDPAFEARIAESIRLIAEGARSVKYGALGCALLPLSLYLTGRTEAAVEGWRRLRGTAAWACAAPFLAGCAIEDEGLRKEVESGWAGAKPPLFDDPAEVEVYKEILGGSVLMKAKT